MDSAQVLLDIDLDDVSRVSDYEFVIVGSGPGGGPLAANLARKGHSVLLLEAGENQGQNPNQEIPAFWPQSSEDPSMAWDFFVEYYADNAQNMKSNHLVWKTPEGTLYTGTSPPTGSKQLGLLYPRAGTLGGCSTHNALFAVLPHDSDWTHIAQITNDKSWSPETMRGYFKRMENCQYLPKGTPGHGFSGWLHTSHVDGTFLEDGGHDVIQSALEIKKGPFRSDQNSASPHIDHQQGVFQPILHMTKDGKRSSVQNYLSATVNAKNADGSKKYPLHIRTNCLATKVLFQTKGNGKPRAIGVEFLEGKSLYAADPRFNNSKHGKKEHVYASKDVIISGGTFNTPQILKLSGIGPAQELHRHSIPVISDLPGVGANLQDNYELGFVGDASKPFSTLAKCTFGLTGDLCLKQWGAGYGPYRGDGLAATVLHTSSVSKDGENDIYLYGGPLKFEGFFPGYSRVTDPSAFTWGILKQHPRNHGAHAGTVTLNSADPRATPKIRFNFFAEGEDEDLQALAEGVALARKIMKNVDAPTGPFTEQAPGKEVNTTVEVKQYIKDQIFSHHATSTCKIGAENDEMACLDSRFRVRGVEGLRVVDASVFPRIPGSFPVLPIMMVSEKATDVILEDHRQHHHQPNSRKRTNGSKELTREDDGAEETSPERRVQKQRKVVTNGKED